MEANITADSNLPKVTIEALAEVVKAGILDELIKKHLHFQGKTDDKWYLQAATKEYLRSGKVSGSLHLAVSKIAKEYVEAITVQVG